MECAACGSPTASKSFANNFLLPLINNSTKVCNACSARHYRLKNKKDPTTSPITPSPSHASHETHGTTPNCSINLLSSFLPHAPLVDMRPPVSLIFAPSSQTIYSTDIHMSSQLDINPIYYTSPPSQLSTESRVTPHTSPTTPLSSSTNFDLHSLSTHLQSTYSDILVKLHPSTRMGCQMRLCISRFQYDHADFPHAVVQAQIHDDGSYTVLTDGIYYYYDQYGDALTSIDLINKSTWNIAKSNVQVDSEWLQVNIGDPDRGDPNAKRRREASYRNNANNAPQ
eukprot:TRINITY_DN136_c0_g2_i3.p1 TRINITY_DN136_c0_g2~~TRINITY_DN136_c0_g2_i3.p1  ORF type:complete len:283 (+),score=-26.25 TRINITY_DN136_c0_g2_i3:223-1071(+)